MEGLGKRTPGLRFCGFCADMPENLEMPFLTRQGSSAFSRLVQRLIGMEATTFNSELASGQVLTEKNKNFFLCQALKTASAPIKKNGLIPTRL